MGELSFDELARRIDDPDLHVVDVLPRASFAARHLPGALSIPLEELDREAPRLLPDRDVEVAVYCGGPT